MDLVAVLIIVVVIALLLLTLLKIMAPGAYDEYVLRDAARRVPSNSSRLAGIVILAAMVFMAAHFSYDLFRNSSHSSAIAATAVEHAKGAPIGVWIGLLCVTVTGLFLSLAPTIALNKLVSGRLSVATSQELRKIRIVGRVA